MHSLAILLLSTPIFGFSLQLAHQQPLQAFVSLDVAHAAAESAASAPTSNTRVDPKQAAYLADIKRRNGLVAIHRPLGIATWGAMTIAEVLGFIQYYNKYGLFAGPGSNPCVSGSATFGQGQCTNPVLHLTAAGITTALYAATFAISLALPDPDDLARGRGEFASRLRTHKLLRWVHFGGMLAQILLGIVIAHGSSFGLDRADDYRMLQGLATVHLVAGLVTYGALTWAGALMTF